MIKKEELMPVESSWKVVINKQSFIFNDKQIKILKQADMGGSRGIVWFDKFAISIPHIQYIERVKIDKPVMIEAGKNEINPKGRKKIAEIKKKLKSINNERHVVRDKNFYDRLNKLKNEAKELGLL